MVVGSASKATFRLIDHIEIPSESLDSRKSRFFFVVLSSHENHDAIMKCLENALHKKEGFEMRILQDHLESLASLYDEIVDSVGECAFGVVVIDGLRPNITFEFGVLVGLSKPCLVLHEKNARTDVRNYYPKDRRKGIVNPRTRIDDDFSDIKGRFHVVYDKNNPRDTGKRIRTQFTKMKKRIDEEFIRTALPSKDDLERELAEPLKQLSGLLIEKKEAKGRRGKSDLNRLIRQISGITSKRGIRLKVGYYVSIAERLLQFGDYAKALSIANDVLSSKPDSVRTLLLKSDCLLYLGRYEEAITTIDQAIKLRPRLEPLWHHKGLIQLQSRKGDEAILSLKTAIGFNKGCDEVHSLYGIALYERNDFKGALRQFDKALKLKSDRASTIRWRAKVLDRLGRTDEAVLAIKRALDMNSGDADSWYIYGELTQGKEALGYFDKALRIDKNHCGSICSKGAALSNMGKRTEALMLFRRAEILARKYDVCRDCHTLPFNLAITLHAMGKSREALREVNRALKINASQQKIWGLRGDILYSLGNFAGSSESYGRAVELDSGDADCWYGLALAELKKNSEDSARSALREAVKLQSTMFEEFMKDPVFKGLRDKSAFVKDLRKLRNLG